MEPAVPVRQVRHGYKEDSQDVSKSKIDEKNFCKSPVLFFVEVGDEKVLYFFHFGEALKYFEDDAEAEVLGEIKMSGYIDY